MSGRRRYLPNINLPGDNLCGRFGGNEYARAAAERQAVNTKVQGSAADLVKRAMINIDESLRRAFPCSAMKPPLIRTHNSISEGAVLVLQLHDELIYEVRFYMTSYRSFVNRSEYRPAQTTPLPLFLYVISTCRFVQTI